MRLILALAVLLSGCATIDGYDRAYAINTTVNRAYNYKVRQESQQPRILQAGEAGDCADYAVTKCAMLVRDGFAPERLKLLKFTRYDGKGHAVCVIDSKFAMDWKNELVPATTWALGAKDELRPYTPRVAWKAH